MLNTTRKSSQGAIGLLSVSAMFHGVTLLPYNDVRSPQEAIVLVIKLLSEACNRIEYDTLWDVSQLWLRLLFASCKFGAIFMDLYSISS